MRKNTAALEEKVEAVTAELDQERERVLEPVFDLLVSWLVSQSFPCNSHQREAVGAISGSTE